MNSELKIDRMQARIVRLATLPQSRNVQRKAMRAYRLAGELRRSSLIEDFRLACGARHCGI
jgi:hypothetical protein